MTRANSSGSLATSHIPRPPDNHTNNRPCNVTHARVCVCACKHGDGGGGCFSLLLPTQLKPVTTARTTHACSPCHVLAQPPSLFPPPKVAYANASELFQLQENRGMRATVASFTLSFRGSTLQFRQQREHCRAVAAVAFVSLSRVAVAVVAAAAAAVVVVSLFTLRRFAQEF